MGTLPDVQSLISSLERTHAASTTDMERIVEALKLYNARNEELEIENSLLRARLRYSDTKNAEPQSAGEEKYSSRHDRRTISESAILKPWGVEGLQPENLHEYWSCFRPGLAELSGISYISDGWTRPLSTRATPSPPLWEPLPHKTSSSEGSDLPSTDSTDFRSNTSCEAAGDRRQHYEDDDFDLHEIEQAMRESENDIWHTAVSKPSKDKKPNSGTSGNESIKLFSEPIMLPLKLAQEKSGKNVISTLPEAYLGKWYAVKSCQTGNGHDGRWKDVPKVERKKAPRIVFLQAAEPQLYHVIHKKFVINNAIFYEHCGGQRCIVLRDRANMILVRNKQLTHTFCIQSDGKLLEVFKDGNMEYKVLSVKE